MMKKSSTRYTTLCAMFLITMAVASAGLASEPIPPVPVPLYPENPENPETTIRSNSYYLYDDLTLKLDPPQDGQKTLTQSGPLWELWVNCPEDNATIKAYYTKLATEQGAVLSEPGRNDLHFRLDVDPGPLFVTFHAQNGKYSLDVLQPGPLPSEVVFGDGQYADRTGDEPEPPLITDYPHSKTSSSTYNDFNQLDLKYTGPEGRVTKTVEGRYWQKRVKMKDMAGRPRSWVSQADINRTMGQAVLAAGGEVLSGDAMEMYFHLPTAEHGELWGRLWPQEGKYTIEIVQVQAMEQVLVFDADAMMARLDALGVLTLDGIYFDTAAATLKPESGEALGAALKLLTDYPDLVLEVGGHTDNVGQPQDNIDLSQRRAASVCAWLIDAGVSGERLEAKGYGEASPVADNETAEGRALNRRVELKKLAGGQVRDVMSLIKPYPGSVAGSASEKKADYELEMYRDVPGGSSGNSAEKFIVTGSGFRQYYEVQDEAGKRDSSLSGVQIRHNYLKAVTDFGGTILAEVSHAIYFRLDNLDGTSTYVAVWAPSAKYQVTAVTVAGGLGDPAEAR